MHVDRLERFLFCCPGRLMLLCSHVLFSNLNIRSSNGPFVGLKEDSSITRFAPRQLSPGFLGQVRRRKGQAAEVASGSSDLHGTDI